MASSGRTRTCRHARPHARRSRPLVWHARVTRRSGLLPSPTRTHTERARATESARPGAADTHRPVSLAQSTPYPHPLGARASPCLCAAQIGLKAEYQGSQGRLLLFYGNKDASALTNFAPAVSGCDGLGLSLSSIPQAVQPRTQAQQMLTVEANGLFDKPPVRGSRPCLCVSSLCLLCVCVSLSMSLLCEGLT
jgi:hypothetical protein